MPLWTTWCRKLLRYFLQIVQNVIVCWNCLYLSQYLFQTPAAECQSVADAIAASSPVSWQHINPHGEFDFFD